MVQLCSSDIFSSPTFDKNRITVEAARSVTGDLSLAAPVPERSVTGARSNHGSRRFPISEIYEGQAFLFHENVRVLRLWIPSKMCIKHHKTI